HFQTLSRDPNGFIVDASGGPDFDGGGTYQTSGTFDVIDTSATAGPNTFALPVGESSGGVYLHQIIGHSSPMPFALGDPGDRFGRPIDLRVRRGVCGPAFGQKHSFTSIEDVASFMTGRWLNCDNLGGFGGVGLEVLGDGTYYSLVEDDAGHVLRGA